MKPVFNCSQHTYSYSLIYPSLEEKEKKRLIEIFSSDFSEATNGFLITLRFSGREENPNR
jgi:hypothetical protein